MEHIPGNGYWGFCKAESCPMILDSNNLPGSKQVSRDDLTIITDFDIPTKAKKPDQGPVRDIFSKTSPFEQRNECKFKCTVSKN